MMSYPCVVQHRILILIKPGRKTAIATLRHFNPFSQRRYCSLIIRTLQPFLKKGSPHWLPLHVRLTQGLESLFCCIPPYRRLIKPSALRTMAERGIPPYRRLRGESSFTRIQISRVPPSRRLRNAYAQTIFSSQGIPPYRRLRKM